MTRTARSAVAALAACCAAVWCGSSAPVASADACAGSKAIMTAFENLSGDRAHQDAGDDVMALMSNRTTKKTGSDLDAEVDAVTPGYQQLSAALHQNVLQFLGNQAFPTVQKSADASDKVVAFLHSWRQTHTGSVDPDTLRAFMGVMPVLYSGVNTCVR
jgi:hypothetical protein